MREDPNFLGVRFTVDGWQVMIKMYPKTVRSIHPAAQDVAAKRNAAGCRKRGEEHMKFVLVGPGQLGQLLLRAAGRDCLVIGRDADRTRQVGEVYGCPWTTALSRASVGDVIAVAVPAPALADVLDQIADCAKPGAIVLNFATAAGIAPAVRQRRPDVVWSEAKLVGSAVGMAHGLPCAIVLSEQDPTLLRRVRDSLPGLADRVVLGNANQVPAINRAATTAALRAVIDLERQLRQMGVDQTLIDAALGGTVPGVALSYQQGTLGGFARQIVRELTEQTKPTD